MSRSWLVQVLGLLAALAISNTVVHGDNLNVGPVILKTTLAPIVIKTTPAAAGSVVAGPANVVAHSATTTKPVAQTNDVKLVPKVTAVPVVAAPAAGLAVIQLSTSKPSNGIVASVPIVVGAAIAPADRVRQYFEPVCSQLEKLQPKQMFKIQSQLKQFVEKTSGRMSLCFMQTYSMDPNLTPINKAQLQTICGSRTLDQAAKGSFKSFSDCAAHNYDPALDAELARIQKSRASLGPDHDHSKDNLASLPHDDDELSLISEVVNKVIADSKISPMKADIKILDLNGLKNNSPTIPIVLATTPSPIVVTKSTTAIPVVKVALVTQAPSLADKLKPSSAPDKKASNDVPTKIILLKDTDNSASTKPPQNSVVLLSKSTVAPDQASGTTLVPVKSITPTAAPKEAAAPATTNKPVEAKVVVTNPSQAKGSGLAEKIAAAVGHKTTTAPVTTQTGKTIIVVTDAPRATSTVAPVASGIRTTAAAKPEVIVSTSTGKPATTTTKKPEVGSTASPKATDSPKSVPTEISKSTMKPIEKVTDAPKKQDKEKEALDSKTKKVVKDEEAEKKKDEDLDAKKAIKSLQAQRAQAHGSPADIRMHQIEHERQMSIDPVGHTIKHQEYEKKKAAIAAAKATTTTKKPQ